jgi:hypothetical protein
MWLSQLFLGLQYDITATLIGVALVAFATTGVVAKVGIATIEPRCNHRLLQCTLVVAITNIAKIHVSCKYSHGVAIALVSIAMILGVIAICVEGIATLLGVIAIRVEGIASLLGVVAIRFEGIATLLQVIAIFFEGIAMLFEVVAIRFEDIATMLEVIAICLGGYATVDG